MLLDDDAFRVTGTARFVQGVSRRRLPFEPRGDMVDYRDQLRTSLRRMHVRPGEGLTAVYAAPDESMVDIENLLLYNVGSAAYGHLTRCGLVLRRAASGDGLHHVTYDVGLLEDPDPEATHVLARAGATLPEPPAAPRTAGDWWALLRPDVEVDQQVHGGRFVVDVALSGEWSGRSVAGAVKPMIDGLVSALHRHVGPLDDEVLHRLASYGDLPRVRDALTDPSRAVLGSRALVRPTKSGMAWNPADDRIDGLRVRVTPTDSPVRRIAASVRCAAAAS